jgi:hypothetical protein
MSCLITDHVALISVIVMERDILNGTYIDKRALTGVTEVRE